MLPSHMTEQRPSGCAAKVSQHALTTAAMFKSVSRVRTSFAARWVATEILPHEQDVRRWLARAHFALEVDDIIQEAYCAIAALDSTSHIKSGRAYLFTTARNIALEHLRRSKIVPMEALSELAPAVEMDERPTAEAIVWSKLELGRLIEALPTRCQAVFRLCYVNGMTQKEAAHELRTSESVVQKQLSRAMARITIGYARDVAPEFTDFEE